MDRERDVVMGFCIGVIIALFITFAVVGANTHQLRQLEKKIDKLNAKIEKLKIREYNTYYYGGYNYESKVSEV